MFPRSWREACTFVSSFGCHHATTQVWSLRVVSFDGLRYVFGSNAMIGQRFRKIELLLQYAIDSLGNRVLIRIAIGCHADAYMMIAQEADVFFAAVLIPPVRMMDQRGLGGSILQCHLERFQASFRAQILA